MSTSRFLELWAPPPGYRLSSVIATTYQLQADFLEEDLLPTALGLRLPSARGREFRLELEGALQDADITIYLHPDGYQPGMRRSPRIDLIPVPATKLAKLHAKVALLCFAPERGGDAEAQIVRLVTGSANLTTNGYRDNIELAVAMDDAPGAVSVIVTAVRDAAAWLRDVLPPDTEQAKAQHRLIQSIFDARPVSPDRAGMSFVGLPRSGGLIQALSTMEVGRVHTLTSASPFWPAGDDLDDVVAGLLRVSPNIPDRIRMIGPCRRVDDRLYAEMPPALLKCLLERGVKTCEVAYANPEYGCGAANDDSRLNEGEYDSFDAEKATFKTWRPLHAKVLLIEGEQGSVLAIGSFNFTRRGLGIHDRVSNTEAGVIWRVSAKESAKLEQVFGFAGPWRKVAGNTDGLVRAPAKIEGESGQQWPAFIHALRANRCGLIIQGDGATWPSQLKVSMRDIRSRFVQKDRHFDPWHISRPAKGTNVDVSLALVASWIDEESHQALSSYPALADLEVTLEWDGQTTVLPVVFLDKHEFPVLERATREDERTLLDWFLGLRPADEPGVDGYGHGIDPSGASSPPEAGETSGILSYLVRDFVHALPGIRTHLETGASTETGLRAVLLGPRSPAKLADEILSAWKLPLKGRPRKTGVATTFQLIELRKVVERATLPVLPNNVTEELRSKCLHRIDTVLSEATDKLGQPLEPAFERYLRSQGRGSHATA